MLPKIKVSVVEDIEEIRLGYSYLINSSLDLECVGTYANAEEVLFEIEKNLPDVIIMDIGLPGISGIECTRQVKLRHPGVEIMICTIYEDDERLFSALSAGASGYILKRTASTSLLDSIRDINQGGSPMSSLIARKVIGSLYKEPTEKATNVLEDLMQLSVREKEILDMLAKGYRNKEISEKLFISPHTVKTHIYNIYEKLHVKSRYEIMKKYPPR